MSVFTQQPKKLKANIVTDEQGRQRFHGAFTGGFSAGHFNTVGSEEGFQPKAFVSSRSNRADHRRANASDFMDTDDGLGGSLSSKNDFDTFDTNSKRLASKALEKAATGSAIPGFMPEELIVVNSNSIGKRLLTLMGWREGQGVGARKVKKSFSVPPSMKMDAISANALDEGAITFAPENDANLVEIPPAKSDLQGVGYDYEKDNSEMAMIRKGMQSEKIRSGVYRVNDVLGKQGSHNGSKFNSLSGFALDDDEDDVYDSFVDTRVNVGLLESCVDPRGEDSDDEDKRGKLRSGVPRLTDSDTKVNHWLESSQTDAKLRERCSDGRYVLQGFTFGAVKVEIPPVYPAIEVPKDFDPYHRFEEDLMTTLAQAGEGVQGEAKGGTTGSSSISISDLQKRRRAGGKTGLVDARAALLGDGDTRSTSDASSTGGAGGAGGAGDQTGAAATGPSLGSGAPDSIFAMLSADAREKIRKSIAGGGDTGGSQKSLPLVPPPPPPATKSTMPPPVTPAANSLQVREPKRAAIVS